MPFSLSNIGDWFVAPKIGDCWWTYPQNDEHLPSITVTTFGTGPCFPDEIPVVKRIIFHDPATIVFWQDGTKTVVKCMEGEPYSKYYGFVCALAKKIYGSNAKITKLIKQFSEEKKEDA